MSFFNFQDDTKPNASPFIWMYCLITAVMTIAIQSAWALIAKQKEKEIAKKLKSQQGKEDRLPDKRAASVANHQAPVANRHVPVTNRYVPDADGQADERAGSTRTAPQVRASSAAKSMSGSLEDFAASFKALPAASNQNSYEWFVHQTALYARYMPNGGR
jgi:hypothetical protein